MTVFERYPRGRRRHRNTKSTGKCWNPRRHRNMDIYTFIFISIDASWHFDTGHLLLHQLSLKLAEGMCLTICNHTVSRRRGVLSTDGLRTRRPAKFYRNDVMFPILRRSVRQRYEFRVRLGNKTWRVSVLLPHILSCGRSSIHSSISPQYLEERE